MSEFKRDITEKMRDPEYAYEFGRSERELEIISWIEENRSALELEPGNFLYRDHFNSESLIAFIKGENNG